MQGGISVRSAGRGCGLEVWKCDLHCCFALLPAEVRRRVVRAVNAVVREVVVADDAEEHVPEDEHAQLQIHPPRRDEASVGKRGGAAG